MVAVAVSPRRSPGPVLPAWTSWVVFLGAVIGAVWALYQLQRGVVSDARSAIGRQIGDSLYEARGATRLELRDSLATHVRTYHGRPRR